MANNTPKSILKNNPTLKVEAVSQPDQPKPKKLLDRLRDAIKHYSYMTEKYYVQWIKRYIFFHNKRHLDEIGAGLTQTE